MDSHDVSDNRADCLFTSDAAEAVVNYLADTPDEGTVLDDVVLAYTTIQPDGTLTIEVVSLTSMNDDDIVGHFTSLTDAMT